VSQHTLVVMAAGIGSRYGGIKQMEPFGPDGELLLDYSVYDALRAGFEDVIFILREAIASDFRELIEPRLASHCRVRYAMQRLADVPGGVTIPPDRAKPWGTAHAVYACRELIDGPFAVINADDFYGRGAFSLLHKHLQQMDERDGLEIALVGYELAKTLTEHGHVSRGVCQLTADGFLEEIHERKRIQRFGEAIRYGAEDGRWIDVAGDATASMNMWGFPASFVPLLEQELERCLREHADELATAEFLLPDLVGDLVRASHGRVRVLPTDERWFGVTYAEDRPRVEAAIRRLNESGLYPSPLWS